MVICIPSVGIYKIYTQHGNKKPKTKQRKNFINFFRPSAGQTPTTLHRVQRRNLSTETRARFVCKSSRVGLARVTAEPPTTIWSRRTRNTVYSSVCLSLSLTLSLFRYLSLSISMPMTVRLCLAGKPFFFPPKPIRKIRTRPAPSRRNRCYSPRARYKESVFRVNSRDFSL